MGGTTTDELNYSNGPTRICGQDEAYAADVYPINGKNRLSVDAIISAVNSRPFSLNSKFRVDYSETEVTYAGASYNLMYSYSGTGILLGFHVDTDNEKAQFKLVIDGEVIFNDISIKFIKDIGMDKADYGSTFQIGGLFSAITTDFDFAPKYPIRFSSTVQLYIKKSDSTNIKMQRYLVQIEKDS